MRRITTTALLFCFLAACNEDPCPPGKTQIGVACIDILPDSAVPDSSVTEDTGTSSDTGNTTDAMLDVCMPSAEMCNGISDDCDDNIDEGACDFPNTQATCEPGGCVVSGCDTGFLDCSEGDGCETASDRNNCGACGVMCGATEGCDAGRCVEHTLDWWWTVDGGHTHQVLLGSGLEQRYLFAQVTNSELTLRSSDSVVSPAAATDAALMAMDESGREIWTVFLANESLGNTAISTIDGVDGVFIAGDFQGRLVVYNEGDEVELNSAGTNRDAFVLRVDAAGTVQTLAQLTDPEGSDTGQSIVDIAVSADGSVFVIGRSWGELATRVGGSAVLDSGVFLHRVGGRTVSDAGALWESLTVDDANIYVGMRLDGPVILGGVEYSSDRFLPLIASYDHDLAFRWAQAPLDSPGGEDDDPLRVHAGNGSVFVSHVFEQMHSFGGFSVPAGGYLASLSRTDGAVEWARGLGTWIPAIGTDEDRVYFAGVGLGTVDLGGGSLGPAVRGDALFGVLQTSGEYESARRFGGLDSDAATEVQPTPSGIMVSGTSGAMNVDGVMFDGPRQTFVFHFSTETED